MECQILYNACVKACGTANILDKTQYKETSSHMEKFNCHFYVSIYKKHCAYPNLYNVTT
jgi:hypothetical protein